MAGIIVRLILSVSVITAMFYGTPNGPVAAAQISVQPLWDVTYKETQCHTEEKNASEGVIVLQGSVNHTCSFQVNASLGFRINIPALNRSDDEYLFYVHRLGEKMECQNRYVVFHGQTEKCNAVLHQESVNLNIEGNVRVVVYGLSSLESTHTCAESDRAILPSPKVNQISVCESVKGYNSLIICDLVLLWGGNEQCRLAFPLNCDATIYPREVLFECFDNGDFQTHTSLATYEIETTRLDLSRNNIVKFENNQNSSFFKSLGRLGRLFLQGNKLTTLPSGLFKGLANLYILYLYQNRLATMHASSFQGLTNLEALYLHGNILSTLPSGLFKGLANLNILYLNENQLVLLNESSFQGLTNLKLLNLGRNKLSTLPSGLFKGLTNLNILYLYENQLALLNESSFQGLANLESLYLSSNKLSALPSGVFEGLANLTTLDLSLNRVANLNESLFQALTKLWNLNLRTNELTKLPSRLFEGLASLHTLDLRQNQLITLDESLFRGLSSLFVLKLKYNRITTLPNGLFKNLTELYLISLGLNQLVDLSEGIYKGLWKLNVLGLEENELTTLPSRVFEGLASLERLDLSGNQLITFYENTFHGLIKLKKLNLTGNDLTTLSRELFVGLVTLYELNLNWNHLTIINPQLFDNLNNLQILKMHNNKLKSLPKDAFIDLRNLRYLSLESNQLKRFIKGVYNGLSNLQALVLSRNVLTHLANDIFRAMVNVTYIDLSNNMLKEFPTCKNLSRGVYINLRDNILTGVTRDTFSSLPGGSTVVANQHEICECYVPYGVQCSALDNRSPYLTCDRLLSDRVLVVLMWLIGINALGGNIFVLIWRKLNTKQFKVQDLILSNLAMSDSIMGFYMVIMACADIHFGEYFPLQSETWRSSVTCRISGALALASSTLSVLFLVLLSIDRYICIKYPYSVTKLGIKSTIVTSALIWVFALVMSIVPSMLSGRSFKFYDNSQVCIGLPLSLTRTYSTFSFNIQVFDSPELSIFDRIYTTQFTGLVTGLYFSTALFLGFNAICYLVILGCYIEIVRAVMMSAKQSGRTQDMDEQIRLTRKVTAIVATDFLCMAPVVVLGILVQTRVIVLPPSVYAWSVNFVLPINSAINPYLYTIAEIISKNRKKKIRQ